MPTVSFAEGTPALAKSNAQRQLMLRKLLASLCTRASTTEPQASDWQLPGPDGVPEETSSVVSTVWGHMDKLRIMSKYLRLLRSICREHPRLQGHESSCRNALEWFKPMCSPMHTPTPDTVARLQTLIYTLPAPRGQEIFCCHRHMVCSDRDMTRMLLAEHFPNSMEYEVDVCTEMLRDRALSFDQWKSDFGRWRERGLAYPLAVAAKAMPSLGYWLPRIVHKYPLSQTFNSALERIRNEGVHSSAVLSDLCEAWQRDDTHLGSLLGQTLDRLAILMRVHSLNGGERNLDAALSAFATQHSDGDMHSTNRATWVSLASDVQDAFPPSLLCPLLSSQHRSSWGIHKLLLETTPDGALGFKRLPLSWIDTSAWEFQHDRQVLEDALLCESAPGGADETYNCRIKDVLWRLGEVCTSPEVATCMLDPKGTLSSISSHEPSHRPRLAAAADPRDDEDHVLSHMRGDVSHTDTEAHYHELTHTMERMQPSTSVIKLKDPTHICMWRVDLPPRALVRIDTEADLDPAASTLHNAQRLLINHKLASHSKGHVHASATPMAVGDVLESVRSWQLHSWDESLRAECFTHSSGRVQLTTLQECVACFTSTEPPSVNRTLLGTSSGWEHHGIDARYAEHQQGDNGFRYRDWVALHCDHESTQQARLAAHCISVSEWHVTQIPWLRADSKITWVKVAATLPIVSRTMRGDTLRQAVESRYMHDPQLLSRADDDDVLTRGNVELYEAANSVAIAYTPVSGGPRRMQMMAFQVAQEKAPPKKNQVRWCDQQTAPQRQA